MKKGQELSALKLKEAKANYEAALEAIKTNFDSGDELKAKKVETA